MNGNFIITGGAQGFGKEFSTRIVRSGGRVVIADVNRSKGEATAEEIGSCIFVQCDVTDPVDWERLWDEASDFFDERGVQVLVNNAGVNDTAGWRKCLDVNMTGLGIGTDLAMRKMSKLNGGQGGVILHLGSIAGLRPSLKILELGSGYYSASKSAVVSLSNNLATVYDSTGVKHMVLCPELADTSLGRSARGWDYDMIEHIQGGMLQAKDVGDAFERMIAEGKNGSTMMVLFCDGTSITCPYPMMIQRRVIDIMRKCSTVMWKMGVRNVSIEMNRAFIGLAVVGVIYCIHLFLCMIGL